MKAEKCDTKRKADQHQHVQEPVRIANRHDRRMNQRISDRHRIMENDAGRTLSTARGGAANAI